MSLKESATTIISKTPYVGGGFAVGGGITANQVAMYGGLLVAFLGLLVNIYYKRREDKRHAELHRFNIEGWDKKTERRQVPECQKCPMFREGMTCQLKNE